MDDNDAEFKTYSLAEVAELILPDMADGVRWLSRRLNNGELSGYRVGRTWRMTREDVTDAPMFVKRRFGGVQLLALRLPVGVGDWRRFRGRCSA
jgi:hypothetical protein